MLGPNILRAGSSWLYPVHKGPLGVFLVSAFEALSWSQSISFFPDMLQRGQRKMYPRDSGLDSPPLLISVCGTLLNSQRRGSLLPSRGVRSQGVGGWEAA